METMIAKALELGACKAAVIPTAQLRLDAAFRSMCESNACGNYGKCWMCPPDVGDIEALMEQIRDFEYALVYQTVTALEDSYDFEGMMAAAQSHAHLIRSVMDTFANDGHARTLHLGVGGCHLCPTCAKQEGTPCRHPDYAVASLETYGIDVSAMAAAAGMKYINGADTVTYFGAMLFSE